MRQANGRFGSNLTVHRTPYEWPESALRCHPTIVDDGRSSTYARTARQPPRVSGLTRPMRKNMPIGTPLCRRSVE
jgi:hypothetical protein